MKKIKLPFEWDLYVAICGEDKLDKLGKRFNLNFEFNEKDKVQGIAEFIYKKSPTPSFFIIWVNANKEEYLYFLLHEIHHIVNIYCKHLEIHDEEFEAYLFEDICKQLKLFKQKTDKDRK